MGEVLHVMFVCFLLSAYFAAGVSNKVTETEELRFFCGPILLSDWSVVKALARRVAELHLQIVNQITNIFDATKDDWALDIGS